MWEKNHIPMWGVYKFSILWVGKKSVASEINDPLLLRHPFLQKLDSRYDIYWLTIEAVWKFIISTGIVKYLFVTAIFLN
jgi:hypothetical protein